MNPFLLSFLITSFWVMVWALPPAIGQAEEPEEELRLPLAMEIFLKKPKERWYEIHIHLTNTSEETIKVNVHDLPWIPPNDSTWLSAYRMDGSDTPIKQTVWRGAFGSRIVPLLPGESIQDKLVLNPRLPSLLEDIDQFGVQLQWECPPPTLKFECKTGSPNRIPIPKGDAGEPDKYTVDKDVCRNLEQAIGLISIHPDHDVLFLLTSEAAMMDLTTIQSLLLKVDDYVRQCKPRWTNSWAVSFFTEKRYAGFLRDGENQRHFEKGLWQQANIGQYSSQIRTLYRFPWSRKKAETVYLSVYQLRQQTKQK